MRVLTLNLWGCHGDWARRRSVLIDGVRELAPDLVAFQECVYGEGYDQAADLLGPGYHLAHQEEREPDGSGVTIGARWPLGQIREAELTDVSPRAGAFAVTTLVASVQVPGPIGRVWFVNHFPSRQLALEYERERQALIAARFVEDLLEEHPGHVVMAGDMDADPDAASIRFLTGRQSLDGMSVCYRDAWESVHPGEPGHTHTPENPLMADAGWPFRRIDHIMVRCGERGPTLTIRDCTRVFDRPVDGVQAGDHYGVMADLDRPGTR